MALVSGGRSTLNPNAPLYIPAALRQVEDFSPEWWELITTSTWFRDYWVSQNQESDMFRTNYHGNNNNNNGLDSNDIVNMLPDDIDLGVDEDLLNMESDLEEFIQSANYRLAVTPSNKGLDHEASKEFPMASKFITAEAPNVASKAGCKM